MEPQTPRPWALIEMLQVEGAIVGLGGGYQPTNTRRWINVSGAGLPYSSSLCCGGDGEMDAISFKTPYDEGEDVYNGTENSELDDEDKEDWKDKMV